MVLSPSIRDKARFFFFFMVGIVLVLTASFLSDSDSVIWRYFVPPDVLEINVTQADLGALSII